jgi:hypothetical protein
MEPDTEKDIWKNVIYMHPQELFLPMKYRLRITGPDLFRLETDVGYQIAMARILYWRVPYPLPAADDVIGQARYWKDFYNTDNGKGTVEEFIENSERYCA